MKIIRLAVLTAILIATANCASSGGPAPQNPGQQIEGRVAFYALSVINMADTGLSLAATLTDQRLAMAGTDAVKVEQIKADARAIITVFKQVGEGGQKLAAALTVMDTATTALDRNNALLAVQTLVSGINRLVTDGTLPVGDDATKAAVQRLFSNVSDLLLQLAFVLPQGAK